MRPHGGRDARASGRALIVNYGKHAVKSVLFYFEKVPKPSLQEAILENTIRVLRDERIRKKLSMHQLAALSGITTAMISLVERGLRNPTLDLLLRISHGLEVDLWRILKKATESAQSGR